MRIHALHAGSSCKSWALISDEAKEAVLVDVVLDRAEAVLEDIQKQALRVVHIVDTHTHADHLSAGTLLARRVGCTYAMHERTSVRTVTRRLREGDQILVGRHALRILHLPGHTKDSLGLVGADHFLTGDFLFLGEGGAGRTDLLGGDPGEHWDSLQKLHELPDHLCVLPGHDYRGGERGVLGEERRKNPRLAARSRDDYVRWLSGLSLSAADWMLDVLKANGEGVTESKGVAIPEGGACCEVGGGSPPPPGSMLTITPAALAARQAQAGGPAFHVLDVREPSEFVGPLGRVPGATNLSLQLLPQRLAELQPWRDMDLFVICLSGARSARAVAILSEGGFSRVYNVEGGTRAWAMAGLPREIGNSVVSSQQKDSRP